MTTPRERVITALNHKQPDICPWHIVMTIPVREKMVTHLGTDNLDIAIGNHFKKFEAVRPETWQEIEPEFWRDEFGVIWDRTLDEDIGNVDHSRLVLPEPTLDDLDFPDPADPGRYVEHKDAGGKYPDLYRINDFGFTLYERAWTLRGMENLLFDMVERPKFVHALLDKICEFNIAIVEQVAKYDMDAILFGDDWGQQHGLIMGPLYWREFFKPRAAKQFKRCRELGMNVFIHSCGDVSEIFPDLIEIGVECFNPFQPEVMDISEIKSKYGDKLSFYGGMSTQKILPYESPDTVREQTRWLIDNIGNSGGYICSPAHDVPKDVPVDNLVAMLEILQDQKPN